MTTEHETHPRVPPLMFGGGMLAAGIPDLIWGTAWASVLLGAIVVVAVVLTDVRQRWGRR